MTARDQFWYLLFAAYFLAHVALRVATGGALGLDEAEIYLDGLYLDWGYGPQLPLYAWLQWATFQITGPSILGLALLKNTLLFATVTALYATLRTRYAPQVAGVAVLSLLLLNAISWESQRALTHSILVNLATVLTFAAVWNILRAPRPMSFVWLGLAMAVGGVSKYNYAPIPAAMILAALATPESRRAILSPWLALSFALAAALLVRPMLWIAQNSELAMSSAHKLQMTSQGSAVLIAAKGMGSLVVGTISFLALLGVVTAALWLVYRRAGTRVPMDDLTRFLAWTTVWSLVFLALITLATGSTNIKDRWLQPVLIFAAPLASLWLMPRIGQAGTRRLVQICTTMAGLIGVGMVLHNTYGRAYRAAPFATLTPQIVAHIPGGGAIVAPVWVAGNMAYAMPDAPIFSRRMPPPPGQPVLEVWINGRQMPAQVDAGRIAMVTAPYRFSSKETLSLAFAPVAQ